MNVAKVEVGKARGLSKHSQEKQPPLIQPGLPIPSQHDLFGYYLYKKREQRLIDRRPEVTSENFHVFFDQISKLISLNNNGQLTADPQVKTTILGQRLKNFYFDDQNSTYQRLQELGLTYDHRALLHSGLLWSLQKDRSETDGVASWLSGETNEKPGGIKKKLNVFGRLAEEILQQPLEASSLTRSILFSLLQDFRLSYQPDDTEYFFPRLTRKFLEVLYRRLGNSPHPSPTDNQLFKFAQEPGIFDMVFALNKVLLLKIISQIRSPDIMVGCIDHHLQEKINSFTNLGVHTLNRPPWQKDQPLSITDLSLKDMAEIITVFSVDRWLRSFAPTGAVMQKLIGDEYSLPKELEGIGSNPIKEIELIGKMFKIPIGFRPDDDQILKLDFFLPCNPDFIGSIMTMNTGQA